MTTLLTEAALALEALELAAERCANAHNRVSEMEDLRAIIKAEAIQRLMQAGVATSASAAEKIVERDEIYTQHRAAQRECEVERWRSLGQWHAAQLRARLATVES